MGGLGAILEFNFEQINMYVKEKIEYLVMFGKTKKFFYEKIEGQGRDSQHKYEMQDDEENW